jgi:thymidylate synthase (FAD)
MEELTDEGIASFLKKLVSLGHFSPLEHVSFSFAIEGVSRNLSHQLVRHRIASYSQKSQRYVNEEGFNYVIPPSILKNSDALALFREKMADLQRAYESLAQLVPKEDARYVLPGACETKLVATFNARSLLNFFQHRCCQRAQWEIRALAGEMLRLVREVAPNLFAKAGPTCVTHGICYEGKMSCGRITNIVSREE